MTSIWTQLEANWKKTYNSKNSEVFIRGEKELVELAIFYLDPRSFEEIFRKNFCFQKPGTMRKARWMFKIIDSIKMVLLGDVITQDLPKGVTFGKGQLGNIKQFVKFVLFIYIAWWITAPVVS